jgi:hypothetical protein
MQLRGHARPDRAHGRYDRQADHRRDQALLDGRAASIIVQKANENRLHRVPRIGAAIS